MRNKLVYRIGHSKDTHRLVKGRDLILAGVNIDYPLGLLGHSDADVVFHAVSESVIGALAMGDLGKHFPDSDNKYKDMDSSYFMKEVYKMMDSCGYEINNIDVTIYIEEPNLSKYKDLMKENICNLFNCDLNSVNIKATRNEGLGFIGSKEGISCEAVCMLVLKNNIMKLQILDYKSKLKFTFLFLLLS